MKAKDVVSRVADEEIKKAIEKKLDYGDLKVEG